MDYPSSHIQFSLNCNNNEKGKKKIAGTSTRQMSKETVLYSHSSPSPSESIDIYLVQIIAISMIILQFKIVGFTTG